MAERPVEHPTLADALARSTAGLPGFAARQRAGADRGVDTDGVLARVAEEGLETVRIGFVDPHGLVRSKTLMVEALPAVLDNGLDFSSGPFLFDTGLDLVGDPFSPGAGIDMPEMEGAADFVAVPDPGTFVVLPWAPTTGWMLADEYFKSGAPIPISGRQVLNRLVGALAAEDMTYVVGLEVEWYLTRPVGPHAGFGDVGGFGRPGTPPQVEPVDLGYQFNSDNLNDGVEDILGPLRRELVALGLPLRTMEHESGPGQIETTFGPLPALEAADAMILFRAAVKQSCARRGYHASFMCKPALPGCDPSGWHLHQSLYRTSDGSNLFAHSDASTPVSPLGRHFAGGLITHAPAACIFTTPTINGYRRFDGEHGLAPSRAGWSSDNRSAMLRVLAGPDDPSSHFENRTGEPAANPYLYIASQLAAGLLGMQGGCEPGPIQPGRRPLTGAPLPTTLRDAVDASRADTTLRAALGPELVDYICLLKDHEINRYEQSGEQRHVGANGVSEWEQREYFNAF